MSTLDLRTRPAPPELANLDRLLRWRYPALPVPAAAPWSEEPRLVLDGAVPWIVTPAEKDPQAVDGRTVMPRAARARLADLVARGIEFPRLAIAHELDAAGAVAGLLPVIEHGPRLCTDDVARALVGPIPPARSERALRAVGRAIRSSGRALAASSDALLDPIVFGVIGPVAPVHGATCLWFPLVAWRW